MITLYRKTALGIGLWRIWQDGPYEIRISHATTLNGQEVPHSEIVSTNESGRTLQEQVDLRIRSRINRQLDKGYVYSIEEAQQGRTNQLGLVLPMLAQPLHKVKKINPQDNDLQFKLDGHRCLATKQEGELILYSRQGKRLVNLGHITRALEPMLPEGTTVDGELYHHGTKLQTIGSWIKKNQPETSLLQLVLYDLVSKDRFRDRYRELQDIFSHGMDGHLDAARRPLRLLTCHPYEDDKQMWDLQVYARSLGYEGLIRRTNDKPYEDGVRSNSLIKIKTWIDCEVTCIGVTVSDKGFPVCECLTDDNKRVDVVPPGDMPAKWHVVHNPSLYLKERLTIEYSTLTEDAVPFHPVAVRWFDEI